MEVGSMRREAFVSTVIGSALTIGLHAQNAPALEINFGQSDFTILESQPSQTFEWDTGDTLVADFDLKGSVGSITGSKNAVVVPEVRVFGNTIVPEVRRDTRTGLRFTSDIEGYVGAVFSAGMTVGGGELTGSIGMGPRLTLPDTVRAGRFFTMAGDTLINHTTSTFDLGLPTLNAGFDIVMGASGGGKIEYGLFPFTGYQIGDFTFNLPDINLPVFNLNLDLNLPRLPEFDFLDLPDLIPESDKDTALFRKKLPPNNPVLSAGEIVLDNPVVTAETTTEVVDNTVIRTTDGAIGRVGLDIDGITTFAATSALGFGVSITGLEASIGKLATVSYDIFDVKYGLELGYEIENRIDSYLEVTLNFFDTASGNPTQLLMRDGNSTTAISSYSGRWDELPELALLNDSDVDIAIDFAGLKRELGQKGSLTLSDYMELKVLAASASITLGPGIDLGPLLYKKFDLAGELAAFEIYDETVTLTDLGLSDGLWDDTITVDAVENADIYIRTDGLALHDPNAYARLDDHSSIANLADKTLIIGRGDSTTGNLAEIAPTTFVDAGTTRNVLVEARTGAFGNTSIETATATGVQDAGQILDIGGIYIPEGSVYRNDGIRRFRLFSIENNGLIDNRGWLDFQAQDLMVISGDGAIFFGNEQTTLITNASGSISAGTLIHGAAHTLDFGPRGGYAGNLRARAFAAGLPTGLFTTHRPLDAPVADVQPNRVRHHVNIGGTFQNQGRINIDTSNTTIDANRFVNDSTGRVDTRSAEVILGFGGRIRVGTLNLNAPTLENLGEFNVRELSTLNISGTNLLGSFGDVAPGLFRTSGDATISFTTDTASSDILVNGNLEFIADSGLIHFERRLEVGTLGQGSNLHLATGPDGTIRLNGLFRSRDDDLIQIDNQGLLDVVSGNVTFQPSPGGMTPSTSIIVPINLNNEGIVRVHAGANLLFDVDIVDFAAGGATFGGGKWELLGANQRFANTTFVNRTIPQAHIAKIAVDVSEVVGNAENFGDLEFDREEDPDTGEIRTSDISQLDTTLVFNNADVTFSGAASFDYFNTVKVNTGRLTLLNQHQFNTAETFENRGGVTTIDSGAGLHVAGALLVNGGEVSFGDNAEFTAAGASIEQPDGTAAARDVEVNGGILRFAPTAVLDTSLITRSRSDGVLLRDGRSWIVRDTVTTADDGSEIVTPGVIDFNIAASNGTPGIVRNDAEVHIAGEQARFDALEQSLLYQHGTLTIADGKIYDSPNTYFRNAGNMSLTGAQFLLRNGEFRNDGPLSVDADSYLAADFFNALTGEVTIEGVVDANTALITSPVHLLGGIFNSQSVVLAGDGEFKIAGGSLLTEQLDGSLLLESGVFAPGQSIGSAEVLGDFTQSSGATLLIEWDSTGADQLRVRDTANLAGTLELSFLNGFRPQVGATIEIINAAAISGAFEGEVFVEGFAAFAATLSQDGNRLLLEVTAVPLPGAIYLLVSVLPLIAAKRRTYMRA